MTFLSTVPPVVWAILASAVINISVTYMLFRQNKLSELRHQKAQVKREILTLAYEFLDAVRHDIEAEYNIGFRIRFRAPRLMNQYAMLVAHEFPKLEVKVSDLRLRVGSWYNVVEGVIIEVFDEEDDELPQHIPDDHIVEFYDELDKYIEIMEEIFVSIHPMRK